MNPECNDPRRQAMDQWLATLGREASSRFLPVTPLAADASFRRYFRTRRGERSFVVMDAPPERETLLPYLRMTTWLRQLQLRVPEILAQNLEEGFLLLEDLGDITFTRALKAGQSEEALYRLAGETLRTLQNRWCEQEHTPGDEHEVPTYSRKLLQEELLLFLDWYWPSRRGTTAEESVRSSLVEAWETTLDELPQLPDVLVLRDFHVDNLMLLESSTESSAIENTSRPPGFEPGISIEKPARLPQKPGAVDPCNRIHDAVLDTVECGLLDFQDAVLGSPAYDLVSLLEDARREVSPSIQRLELQRYLEAMPFPAASLIHHYRVLGVQRTLKIIGIFTRLDLRDGKPSYQRHQPRLWRLLRQGLEHPELFRLRLWVNTHFKPEEDPCAP